MYDKLVAVLLLLRQGEVVINPKAWKDGQITVSALVGVLLAAVKLAQMFGYNVPIDPETAGTISAGVLAVVNIAITVISSAKVGLPPVSPPADPPSEKAP